MKRFITFDQNIIQGSYVREILDIFPELENRFKQRKNYDEYYYSQMAVDVNLEQLQALSETFYNTILTLAECKIML